MGRGVLTTWGMGIDCGPPDLDLAAHNPCTANVLHFDAAHNSIQVYIYRSINILV